MAGLGDHLRGVDLFRGLARVVVLAMLSTALALPACAQVREGQHRQSQPPEGQPQKGQQGQAAKGKKQQKKNKVKPPPPPLFAKHRRGIYRNAASLLVIDAAPQSPPLETDDPGVPDKGEYEVNLTTRADISRGTRSFDFLFVDANYGIVPRIFCHGLPTQVSLELPLEGAKPPEDPMRVGVGSAEFGLKFNFHNEEHTGLYLAVYPRIEFAVPGTDAAEKGLAEPGQTLILPLLVQKELKYITVVANGAFNQPIHDPAREVTGTLGLGVGRALTPHVAAMAEVHSTSTFDLRRERLIVANIGLMSRLRDDVTGFAKIGHSMLSDDGAAHTYVGVGVKLVPALGK